ncbi:MAG: tRNA (adenosine(37)-N6)-dimethylallyltransferase MiaA [Actinobacteria bacterium HGW-Actinobacteria-1]|nr:MAG: tRNA (adenosine(37)-N6)-dimethylallyltransferase MiaA [Actinobacteria bacterium HGW-Actinobacteria-1]
MVIAIVGPTAVGKTDVAEQLAADLGGELVSADSMQVYRGMDIGTAKPTPSARRVPYHCIDLVEPGTPYSAALYQRDARSAIDDIAARGKVPVLCGGTGLYVRAALDDWEFPTGDLATPERARLETLAGEIGPLGMHERLAAIDPAAAAAIHPNNVRRVVRALEMAESGASYAVQAERFSARNAWYPATFIGLTMERSALYARIDARVDSMLDAGLAAEVADLLNAGYRDALTAAQAIGYKEIVPVLDGESTLADAASAIKQATRRYAKRQLTWFRGDPRIQWLDVTGLSAAERASDVRKLLESSVT